jgi:soluble lytic murein transglycosylase
VGAVGMMQLMPETAQWISAESGLPAESLSRPEENIPLGAWYLNHLLQVYHNNEVLALAAYNAGPGNVDQWIEDYSWEEGFTDMNEIPFPETREFVKSVTSARDRLEAERRN